MRQSNGNLRAAQSAAKVTELHQIIHRHRKFQFASLCIIPFRKSQVATNLCAVLVHHGWVWRSWKPLRWFARFIIEVSGSSSEISWGEREQKGQDETAAAPREDFDGKFMFEVIESSQDQTKEYVTHPYSTSAVFTLSYGLFTSRCCVPSHSILFWVSTNPNPTTAPPPLDWNPHLSRWYCFCVCIYAMHKYTRSCIRGLAPPRDVDVCESVSWRSVGETEALGLMGLGGSAHLLRLQALWDS